MVGKFIYICPNVLSEFLASDDYDSGVSELLSGGGRSGRGGRLIRKLSSASLPCMKVIEEIDFLFTSLHGAHFGSDFGSTWRESTHSFVHNLVLAMSHVYSSVDRKKACAPEELTLQ